MSYLRSVYHQNRSVGCLFPSCFANGLPASEARVLADPGTAVDHRTQPEERRAGWKTIPSWAVIGTADHVIPPAEQLAMARQAHAHITEVRAPHLSMISDPGVVTQVITEAAQATG
jgi:pimeloyl-ACP methyl ester carboxylesterase